MIEIKVTNETVAGALMDLVKFTTLAVDKLLVEAPGSAAEVKAPAELKTLVSNSDTPPIEPHTEPASPVEEPDAPWDEPEKPAGPPPSLEKIREKGIAAAKKYGQPAVRAILEKLGAANMTALAEQDRAAFLEELDKLGDSNA